MNEKENMPDFNVATAVLNNAVSVCTLAGDLDAEHFDTVMEEFDHLLDSPLLGLILVMTDVRKVAVPVYGVLVNAARILKGRGGKLVLAGVPEDAARFVSVLGLGEMLDVAPNMDSARRLVANLR